MLRCSSDSENWQIGSRISVRLDYGQFHIPDFKIANGNDPIVAELMNGRGKWEGL